MPIGVIIDALSVVFGGLLGAIAGGLLKEDFKERMNMVFACSLGAVVSLVAVPQCVIFLILFFASTVILPLTNDAMIADFKACGGFIMLATGFRMIKVKMFPIADMVPAMILVMPISALWANYILPLVS